jgi:filamentous hemagglutinin family protein
VTILAWTPACLAQSIVRDGSIGPDASVQPTGPHYVITEAMGERPGVGSNLFHSFDEFNVLGGQSATFTGPGSIENVLSRVTGGNQSSINGLLRSSIPGADFYLLNPAGIFFGPRAQLDIDRSAAADSRL